jgi:hypothetical protein
MCTCKTDASFFFLMTVLDHNPHKTDSNSRKFRPTISIMQICSVNIGGMHYKIISPDDQVQMLMEWQVLVATVLLYVKRVPINIPLPCRTQFSNILDVNAIC